MKRLAPAAILAAALALAGCSSNGSTSTLSPGSSSPSASASGSTPSPAATYTAPPASLPATAVTLSTDPPPWLPPAVINNGAQSAAYVAAAGLPYAEEMLTVHYHAHLDVNVNGKPVQVPPYIGIVTNGNKALGLAPLHTHDGTGVIHIENAVPATFYLGQVFIEWGVRFSKTCLGPYCTGNGKELGVFVDGIRYTGDPTRLVLKKHQEIAVEYGPAGNLPKPPSSYSFSGGL